MRTVLLCVLLLPVLLLPALRLPVLPLLASLALAQPAFAQPAGAQTFPAQPLPAQEAQNPFGHSQLEEVGTFGAPGGGPLLTVRGFVDAGYVHITQSGGPQASGGDLSWAYGNSQFNFSAPVSTFAVNQASLRLESEREANGLLVGAKLALSYTPSRDEKLYQGSATTDPPYQVEQAYAYLQWLRLWNTRVALGRAPGFLTLEQQEALPRDDRLIGHTYVYQAGGGYPYGLQVQTWPVKSLAVKLGVANGGMGGYGFFPGDRSTLNRPVARNASKGTAADHATGRTTYGAVELIPYDEASGWGTLTLGVGAARNPALTYNAIDDKLEPYAFRNQYLAYRLGAIELRAENASLKTYYEDSLGEFDATMAYLLLSYHLGPDNLFTLRGERISYVTDRDATVKGKAGKNGLSYRYRVSDALAIKVEALTEVQSPQYYQPAEEKNLTTRVLTTSWVYSF